MVMTHLAKTNVVAVGMFDSIHFARWLELFADENISFTLLPSSPHRRIHTQLKKLISNGSNATYDIPKGLRTLALPLWFLDKAFDNRLRSFILARTIRLIQPDYVHALELQNGGYVALRAFENLGSLRPKLILTNYGSDIFWFARKPAHRRKLSRLLAITDSYAAECIRDIDLAKSLGFKGRVLPTLPNAGGFSRTALEVPLTPASSRNLIMVKGYHGWVGRAHVALAGLEALAQEIAQFEIHVFSCNLSTKRLAAKMAKRTGLTITAYSKGALSHDEMLEKFSQALIYVGLSLSDGISTSMLEAMAMGAIPVQTSTACCDEWFSKTGVAIEILNAEEVALGIQRAIGLALTTDSAAKNREIIRARASREEIAKQALTFYQL